MCVCVYEEVTAAIGGTGWDTTIKPYQRSSSLVQRFQPLVTRALVKRSMSRDVAPVAIHESGLSVGNRRREKEKKGRKKTKKKKEEASSKGRKEVPDPVAETSSKRSRASRHAHVDKGLADSDTLRRKTSLETDFSRTIFSLIRFWLGKQFYPVRFWGKSSSKELVS